MVSDGHTAPPHFSRRPSSLHSIPQTGEFAPEFFVLLEFLLVPTFHAQGSTHDARHFAGAAQGQTAWKTQPSPTPSDGPGSGRLGSLPQKFPHLTLAVPHQPENTLRVCPFHSVIPKTTAALSSRGQLSFLCPSHPSPTRDLLFPSLSGLPQPGAAQSPEEPLIG